MQRQPVTTQTALASINAPLAAEKTSVDWFRKFSPEQKKRFRRVSVKTDKNVRELVKGFSKFRKTVAPYIQETGALYESNLRALPFLRDIIPLPTDIANFSIAIAKFQDEFEFNATAGLFLSTVINVSGATDFTIITSHLEQPIHYLGFMNEKRITVHGNLGDSVGRYMERGLITVKGNVNDCVGSEAKGGRIIVEGNARIHVGFQMAGGNVRIKGHAGNWVGHFMKSGTINLDGSYAAISPWMKNGRVYHRGRRLSIKKEKEKQ